MADAGTARARVSGIDALRVFAILAVICIHTRPFSGTDHDLLHYVVRNACRWAVPFFFVVTGYFAGCSVREGKGPWGVLCRYAWRLVPAFLCWAAIYAVVSHIGLRSLRQNGLMGLVGAVWEAGESLWSLLAEHPVTFLMQGTPGMMYHLWYIPAVLCGLAIVTILTETRLRWLLVPIAVGLYILGVLASSYSSTVIGLQMDWFPTRNGPFFSTLCVALGWLAGTRDRADFPPWICAVLLLLGAMIQTAEVGVLWACLGVAPDHDYTFGTVVFGFGVFLLALARPDMMKETRLPSIGRLTFGVYMAHMLVVDRLFDFGTPLHPLLSPALRLAWEAAFPLVVFAITLAGVVGWERLGQAIRNRFAAFARTAR